MPFRFLPDISVTGTVLVRDKVEEDAALIVHAGDHLLYPEGPAAEMDTADLLFLVNGEDPALDDEEPGLPDD